MTDNLLRSVVVVGDDAATWMAAAGLVRALGKHCTVRVIATGREPHGLAALRGAEGTLPALRALHQLIGIDEDDFVRRTGAGFKLGTLYRDWSRRGRDYFHPFGAFGAPLDSVAFHHHWMRLRALGADLPIEAYSLGCAAARAGRFARPLDDPRSVLSTFSYGLHLDSAQYAIYLRRVAEAHGVAAAASPLAAVERDGDLIKSVRLADGSLVEADLFIDCDGVLVADIVAYEDWSQWLPCDRLMAVVSAGSPRQVPYTEIRAGTAGWHWRIPLHGTVVEGLCYSSRYMQTQEAREALSSGGSSEPTTLSFINGRRSRFWTGNVVALGEAAGFLEPLEATNLHLVHSGLVRLLSLLPYRDRIGIERDEYNRLTAEEWERTRDFLVLHYKATQRDDSAFWTDCRAMSIPETLSYKIRLFDARGHVVLYDEEPFAEQDYLAVFLGQEVLPRRYDPVADTIPVDLTSKRLDSMRAAIRQAVEAMPAYTSFLARYGTAAVMHP